MSSDDSGPLAEASMAVQALLDRGRVDEAVALTRRLAKRHRGDWRAHQMLAASELRAGAVEAAADAIAAAVDLAPNRADLRRDRARLLLRLERHREACAEAASATGLDPADAENWVLLGRACRQADRLSDAEDAYRVALARDGKNLAARVGLGLVSRARGDLAAAEAAYRGALEIEHDNVAAQFNLANVMVDRGRPDQAVRLYRRVLASTPGSAAAHYNLALASLLAGSMEDAWRHYEWRYRDPNILDGPEPPNLGGARWLGGPLAGETVLVTCEQGYGDAIQFARFVPAVRDRGGRPLLRCPRSLADLFARSFAVDAIFALEEPIPPATRIDFSLPLMSLPHALGMTWEAVAPSIPYLRPDPAKARAWSRLAKPGTVAVGLVWQGSPHYQRRAMKVPPRDLWHAIASVENVRFFGLQVGEDADQDIVPGADYQALGSRIDSFDDTAAIISELDLVITVDTAAAHLAGALGKAVWVLLPHVPDWRWMLDRPDSPWYPTMRLFRQPRPGDWATVFADLSAELQRVALERFRVEARPSRASERGQA